MAIRLATFAIVGFAFCLFLQPRISCAQSPADPSAKAPAAGTNYQVIPYSHNSAVMIDLQTGKTWKLERDAENSGHFVWVPIRKLETNMELDDWEQRMKKFKAERRKRREAEFGAADPLEGRFDFDEADFAVPEADVAESAP